MICALTVRKLKPGTFDDFRDAFMTGADPDRLPEGWVRFNMVRNADDPDEVICFGFFDGSIDDLRKLPRDDYDKQQEAIAPYVESVGADGIYEVVEEHAGRSTAAA